MTPFGDGSIKRVDSKDGTEVEVDYEVGLYNKR